MGPPVAVSPAFLSAKVGGNGALHVRLLLSVALATLVASGRLQAQPTITIEGQGCRACLRFTPTILLGDESDAGAVAVGRGLIRLRDGSFVHATGRGELVRFSPTGRPAGRIGRKGSGPLEFRSIDFLLGDPHDTLIVFDGSNGRAATISPAQSQVRQFPITSQVTNAVLLPNGDIVANIPFEDARQIAMPVQVLDRRSGAIMSSFGTAVGERVEANEAWAGWRELAVSPSGTVWTARRNRYLLEEWDRDGRRLRAIERRTPWFMAYTTRTDLTPSSAPQPSIARLHVDGAGRVWVFVQVAATNWREGIEARRPMPGMVPGYEPKSLSAVYHTMVEVIDPDRRTVLASQRLPALAWGMLSDDALYSDAQADDGVPRFRLWRAALDVASQNGRR